MRRLEARSVRPRDVASAREEQHSVNGCARHSLAVRWAGLRQRRDDEQARGGSRRRANDQLLESALHLTPSDLHKQLRDGEAALQKNFRSRRSAESGIEAASFAITVTVCRTCDIFVRLK